MKILEFEASLIYRASPRTARATLRNPNPKGWEGRSPTPRWQQSRDQVRVCSSETASSVCPVTGTKRHLGGSFFEGAIPFLKAQPHSTFSFQSPAFASYGI